MPRKRPCCICRHWFRPDPRVGSRQRACRQPECQARRRQKNQAAWRKRNPDYFYARRMQVRGAKKRPEPLRLPPPLSRLPWDIAQDEMGVQAADFLGVMGTLILRVAQSQFRAYRTDSRAVPDTLPPPAEKDQMRVGA
jgi:hypothetical protein